MKYNFLRGQIWECYKFAKNMIGNHNPNMIMERTDWEIFRDDFRGKLGEVALKNYITRCIPTANISSEIDFTVTPRGQWDIYDLIVNDKHISVKSIKGNANFLMIETKRFTHDGHYSYNNNNNEPIKVDLYALVKVYIEPELEEKDMNYKNISELWDSGIRISYEILGGISHDDFWNSKHFAPKGMFCSFDNLKKLCENRAFKMVPSNSNFKKTEVLQQDNYILDSSTELCSITKLL